MIRAQTNKPPPETARKRKEVKKMADVYEIVTQRILEQLDQGIIPWHKPWTGGQEGAYNYVTGRSYSVLNQMILNHADAYLTFKQVQDLGGKVKKGAKSEIVTFWKMIPIKSRIARAKWSRRLYPT